MTSDSDSGSAVASLAALAQATRLSIFRLLLAHAPDGLTPGAIVTKLSLAPATLSFISRNSPVRVSSSIGAKADSSGIRPMFRRCGA